MENFDLNAPQTLIVGDLHGCFDSLMNLLDIANFRIEIDKLIAVGDFTERGPKSREVLDFFINNSFKSVRGNHCDKIFRLHKNGKAKIDVEIADTLRQLGEDSWKKYAEYLGGLPLYIPIEFGDGAKGFVVHAGIAPHSDNIAKNDKNILMRVRNWPFEKFDKNKKENDENYWARAYEGRLGIIVHGHAVREGVQDHGNANVYSLDGGCVYGGTLRALRLSDRKIFEVEGAVSENQHYNSLLGDNKLNNFLNPDDNGYVSAEKVFKFFKKREAKCNV